MKIRVEIKVAGCNNCVFCGSDPRGFIFYCDCPGPKKEVFLYTDEMEKIITPDWCPLKQDVLVISFEK